MFRLIILTFSAQQQYLLRHTNDQVSGGAYSMLLIDEQNTVIDGNVNGAANIEAWYNNELHLVASQSGSTYLGNGLSNLVIPMIAEEWYRMRVLAVDPAGKT